MYESKFPYIYYCLVISFCLFCKSSAIKCETKCCENNPAVKNFKKYVQIDTSGEKNLRKAVAFLAQQAAELELPFSAYYPDGYPICVFSWIGTNSSLPSIMLNSHVDVVPVEEKFWTYQPFSAHIDENCYMHGRGTQDTKGVTIQYIEAIRKLMQSNVTLQRTLHITVMPDEETGGFHGIKPFIKTKDFSELNVGFVLDEGLTSVDEVIYVSYQDKRAWQMKFTVFGKAGHGSSMPNSNAMEKMYKLLSIIMKFREEQNEIKKQRDPLDFGAHTSININIIKGGTTPNVIPSKVSMVVDMRLAANVDVAAAQAIVATKHEEVKNGRCRPFIDVTTLDVACTEETVSAVSDLGVITLVDSWRAEAGNDTLLEFIRRDEVSAATPLQNNPFWKAMQQTANDIGITLKPLVIPATSDMLVLRNMGISALGFAPRVRTPNLIHSNDEYLSVKVFLEGIDVYTALLKSLGNV